MHHQTTHKAFNIIVIVAALGYFVDVYDLILFSIVRVPSLQSLGLKGEELTTTGINLLNIQMLGMLLGGVDFKDYKATLVDAVGTKAAVTLNYGMFIQNVIDFLIIAFAIFMAIKALNAAKKKEIHETAAPAMPSAEVMLLEEIRDLLKAKK